MWSRYHTLSVVTGLLLLLGCQKPLAIQDSSGKFYTIGRGMPGDSGIAQMLAPYKAGMDVRMQAEVGRTDIPLTKAQPECTLGNFIADAQMTAARNIDSGVAGSVMNYGGIRLSYIAPGPITRERIYELMPFDNKLVIVDMPGEALKKFCGHMARYGGWPVSGISFTIRNREAENIRINGREVNDHIVYKIAMSDYIAHGGDHCDFLVPLRKRYTAVLVRDAMIEYVHALDSQGRTLHPKLEKRVQYAE